MFKLIELVLHIMGTRTLNHYYNTKRYYFLVNKFNECNPELTATKLRNWLTNQHILFSTSSPCCGLGDENFITSISEDDVKDIDRLLSNMPVRQEFGEQNPDNDEVEYYDCFSKKIYHCSICKLSGHNKRTCKNVPS